MAINKKTFVQAGLLLGLLITTAIYLPKLMLHSMDLFLGRRYGFDKPITQIDAFDKCITFSGSQCIEKVYIEKICNIRDGEKCVEYEFMPTFTGLKK